MAAGRPQFNQHVLIDTTPMPDHIPKVQEIGATSAPLLSASYFIGARCRPYNDDYMQCKTEAYGRGELECMKEGRKVTRCAASVLEDINTHCLEEFRSHWNCLEHQNHQLYQCRRPERRLNKCVFDKLGLEKHIPDTAEGETPVHLRQKMIYASTPQHEPGHPDAPEPPRLLKGILDRIKETNMKREHQLQMALQQKQQQQQAGSKTS